MFLITSRSSLRDYFLSQALIRDEAWFAERLWNIPFEPYAPVRKQLLRLLMQINTKRKRAGLSKLSPEIIRYRRKPVRVYRTLDASSEGIDD